ncbi:SDR family oxidoreductase [Kribbella lupini]|uniref:SDR family oxidoreductase n=1 Tax=Kribbella lupini TaxID=291602 RepID=A0ABP4KUQ8_9ACTN
MILVAGATGQLGRLITRTLMEQGKPVRILVRTGSSYDELVAAGAQPVTGDLKDPRSLRAACAGVTAILTTANSMGRGGDDTVESVDRVGNRNLVEAAVAEGVRRFVFTSVLGADPESVAPFIRAKGETEQRLRDSALAWTALQPDAFMDTWVPAVVGGPALAGQPVTVVGDGLRRHTFVAVRDVAAYAVAALDRRDAEGRALPIGGPQALTWGDIVDVFEQELGRPVGLRTVPPGQPVPGMPDFAAELLAMLNTYDSDVDSTDLASSFGVTPTPVAEFVRSLVAAHHQHAG